MVGDHIYLNIGGIFSLKPFNLTGIAGGLLFISLSFDEPLLKQYNKSRHINYCGGFALAYSINLLEFGISLCEELFVFDDEALMPCLTY